MKLETVEQRHKFIDKMISKAYAFEESLIHDSEHGYDWCGAMDTVENLVVIEEFIRTEEILFDAFAEIEDVPFADENGKRIILPIVNENLISFIDKILLDRIEYAFDNLGEWHFVTEEGIKFRKNIRNKLDALIGAYQDIYDL